MALVFQFSKEADGSLKVVKVIEYLDSFAVKELKAKMGAEFRLPCDL